MRGKCFVCQEPGCWEYFLLCIKCIKYKATIHPHHNFKKKDTDEFEELEDTEEDTASETEEEQGEEEDESGDGESGSGD